MIKGSWNNSEKAEQLRMQNPFGDFDKDKVININDCQPFNPNEHGWIGDTWKSIKQRVTTAVTPVYKRVTSYVKPYVAPITTAVPRVTQVVKKYTYDLPETSYEVAEKRRKKRKETVRKIGEIEDFAKIVPRRKIVTPIAPKDMRPEIFKRQLPPSIFGTPEGAIAAVRSIQPVVQRGARAIAGGIVSKAKEAWKWQPPAISKYERKIERAETNLTKFEIKGKEKGYITYEGTEPIITLPTQPKSILQTHKREGDNLLKIAKNAGWIGIDGVIRYPDTEVGRTWAKKYDTHIKKGDKFATPDGYYKQEYFEYTPAAKNWWSKYDTEQKKLIKLSEEPPTAVEVQKSISGRYTTFPIIKAATKGIEWYEKKVTPKYEEYKKISKEVYALAAKQGRPSVFSGVELLTGTKKGVKGETIAEKKGKGVLQVPPIVAGVFGVLGPTATEMVVREPKKVPGYATYTTKETAKYGIEHPIEFATSMIVVSPIIGAIAKPIVQPIKGAVYNIPPLLRGVRPYVGEPTIVGKIVGKKYHPTLEARPLAKTQLAPEIFKTEMPYFHGTSQTFLETIKRKGGIDISPKTPVTSIESGLFFGAPKRPYTAFVSPTKMIRVKSGDITKVPDLKSYVTKGAKPSAKVEIPYDIYAEAVLKSTKRAPSTKLSTLIEKQKTIQKQIGEELLPRTKTELRGKQAYLQEKIYQQAIKDSGIKTAAFEASGAFLEFKTIPKKPSPKITSMSLELEKLIIKLEKGTKAERAKAAKYRDILEKTRWEWRFKRVSPKYGLAKEVVATKKKAVMSAKEIKRMDYLKAEIKKLGLKEFERAAAEAKLGDPAKAIAGKYWKGIGEVEHVAPPGMELYPLESARGRLYSMFGIEKGKYRIYDPMSQRWTEVLGVSEKAPRGYKLPGDIYKKQLKAFTKEEIAILKRLEPAEAARYIAGHKLTKFLVEEKIPVKKGKINFGEIEGIPRSSAKAIEKYFEKYPGEYRFYGSIVERTQLGVKKIPGDLDVGIGNPKVVANNIADIIKKTSGRKVHIKEYKDPTGALGGTRYEVLTQVKGKWATAADIGSIRGHLGGVIAGKYIPSPTTSVGGILMEQVGEQLAKRASTVFQPGKGRLVGKVGPKAAGRITRLKDIPKFEEMATEMIKRGKKAYPTRITKYKQAEELLNVAMGRKKAKFNVTKELTTMSKKYIKPKPDVIIPTKKVSITKAKPILDLGDIYKKMIEVKPKKLTASQFKEIGKLKAEIERAYKEGNINKVRRLESRINQIRYAPKERIYPIAFKPTTIDREPIKKEISPLFRDIFPERRVERVITTPERLLGITPERGDRRGVERAIERIIGREMRPERREERHEKRREERIEKRPERRIERKEERIERRPERIVERRIEPRPEPRRTPIITIIPTEIITIPKPKKKVKKKKVIIRRIQLGAYKYGEITPVAMPTEALGLLGVGTVEKGKYVYNPKDAAGFLSGE